MNQEVNSGTRMHGLARELFPICRSITGDGVRETLQILRRELPDLVIHEVPSGTRCFDWIVPDEWNIRDAKLEAPTGELVCTFSDSNLHVVGYSTPIDVRLPLADLSQHLYSLPHLPDAIPYVTSYYQRRWGFCLRHADRVQLIEGVYRAFIDSTLEPGFLTLADLVIPGKSSDEVLISTYTCHPSMANNEISGPVVAVALAQWIGSLPERNLTYRFVFAPETIGAIVYLSRNLDHLRRHVKAAFNLTCIGDDRSYSFGASRRGDTLADRVIEHVMKHGCPTYRKYSYLQRGSDERQYCWPGVDLPMVTVMRSRFGDFPEYHTSLDDLSVISPDGLLGGLTVMRRCVDVIERCAKIPITQVLCEPQLSRRGLYRTLGHNPVEEAATIRLDLMAYADGTRSLLDIADMLNRPAWQLVEYVNELETHGLIR